MNRHTESWPDVARADAGTVMLTIRHVSDRDRAREMARSADAERQKRAWPVGPLSWSLFGSTYYYRWLVHTALVLC